MLPFANTLLHQISDGKHLFFHPSKRQSNIYNVHCIVLMAEFKNKKSTKQQFFQAKKGYLTIRVDGDFSSLSLSVLSLDVLSFSFSRNRHSKC
jgi:hypothetical protein